MRAPGRRRPQRREFGPVPDDVDLAELARSVSYVGSPEHKDAPSFAGQPRPRLADASICDRRLANSQRQICRWLRTALSKGAVAGPWEGGYPRYVWYRNRDTVYEGRLVNRGKGEYKGYPLETTEWPTGINSYYPNT